MGKIQEIIDSRQFPGISTPDTFGYKNHFIDERTHITIDTWKKWERAGYKDIEYIKNKSVKDRAKKKAKQCRQRGDRKLTHKDLSM